MTAAFAKANMAGAARNVPARQESPARMATQQEISAARQRAKIGKTVMCIVDEVDGEGGANARSYADAPDIDGTVYLRDAADVQPGQILPVLIEDADEYDLFGVPV